MKAQHSKDVGSRCLHEAHGSISSYKSGTRTPEDVRVPILVTYKHALYHCIPHGMKVTTEKNKETTLGYLAWLCNKGVPKSQSGCASEMGHWVKSPAMLSLMAWVRSLEHEVEG